jgi:primosomal protein N' (replication factor Y)
MFVRVAVPRSAPEALVYRVPDELRPFAQRGVRARVPLRNKTVTGLITSVESSSPVQVERMRDVDEIIDTDPVILDHLLDFAEFIAGYYRCPLGDTLAAMIPAALLRSDSEVVKLTPKGAATQSQDLGPTQKKMIDALKTSGSLKIPSLLAHAGTISRSALDALKKAHLVTISNRRRDRAPKIEVAAVRLKSSFDLANIDQICARAPKQREVLEWLAERGRPVLAQEICQALGVSPATVYALAEKGAVERFTQARAQRQRWTLSSSAHRPLLSEEQQVSVDALLQAIEKNQFGSFVLEGVTGAGKTEVYLRALEKILSLGRGGIVLVPEIGLTPAAVGAIESRFASRTAVLHSAQTDGERWREWRRIHSGEATVVVGPRSALFSPVKNLGFIVVDEEQDGAYKQQEAPRYHARDMALVLAKKLEIPVLMCSATPSTEATSLAERGLATKLVLSQRVAGGTLPEVELVDLRTEAPDPGEQGRTLFSSRLKEALGAALDSGHQAILLMQRRGWAPTLLCRDCGHRVQCPSCSVSLVVHRRDRSLRCHYCGLSRAIPHTCPECRGGLLDAIGAGTEKIAARFSELFPDHSAAVLDRDSVRRRAGLEETLGSFAAGKTRVLIGTQMVAKGHHFPNVTLTGVISADAMLSLPDFRAGERTFQLLTQVAGRAGRGSEPGRVILQTYYPEHPAVRHAARHDSAAFLKEELLFRSAFAYPPAARMAVIRFESTSESATREAAILAARTAADASSSVRVRGPAPAPIERIRNRWRWQILLTAPNRATLHPCLAAIEGIKLPKSVNRIVDVDPYSAL